MHPPRASHFSCLQGFGVDQIMEKLRVSGVKAERPAVEQAVAQVAAEAPPPTGAEAEAEAAAAEARAKGYNTGEAEQLRALNEYKEKIREQQAESDPQAQQEAMLKMKTARFKKAR